jgi:hypothetical protein
MECKMEKQTTKKYVFPQVSVTRVILEGGIAADCIISPTVTYNSAWDSDLSDTPATNNQDVYVSW